MNVTMMQRATARSERGATIFVALLLMLVCIALCAVVISAASAVAGHFKDRAEADQRYYAVTSAARVFEASLGDDGELTISNFPKVSQMATIDERSGNAGAESGGTFAWTPIADSTGAFSSVNPSDGNGYDFLPNLTALALYGNNPFADGWTGLNTEPVVNSTTWKALQGVSANRFTIKPKNKEFYYELTLPGEGSNTVKVNCVLTDEWQLTLDFNCGDDEQKSYHLYMVLVGEADPQASWSEKFVSAKYDGTQQTEQNSKEITVSYTPKVKWRLQQIIPGRVV